METNSVKVSWILLLIVHCVVIILALIVLFVPKVFVVNEFQSFTGQQWSDFEASNPQVSSYMSMSIFEVGIFDLTAGISALFVTLFAYRKGEKWAWYLLLILHTIGWGGAIRSNLYTGDMVVVTICIVFLVIAYVGLAIAGKAILKKVST
jgi:hypothetical protein